MSRINQSMNRKADLPMWLVSLIITLIVILALLFIVAKTSNFNNGFLDFLKRWF